MKKIILTLLFGLLSYVCYCQNADSSQVNSTGTSEFYSLLVSSIDDNDWARGVRIARLMLENNEMKEEYLIQCAECFMQGAEYERCISFCDAFLEKRQSDVAQILTNAIKGECYLRMQDNKNAEKYLEHHLMMVDSLELDPIKYYVGLYAQVLHNLNNFEKSNQYFQQFVTHIMTEEGLPLDKIHLSVHKENYGSFLYTWAYNYFYMGQENRGFHLLKIANNCGYQRAKDDFEILSKCPTFNKKEVTQDSFTIKEFKKNIEKFDFKYSLVDSIYTNRMSFWNELTEINVTYQELLKETQKDKPHKLLKEKIEEIEGGRFAYDSLMSVIGLPRKGKLEQSLENELYGNELPIKGLVIDPDDEVNAYVTPYGHIFLNEGILRRFSYSQKLLSGVCAHESAHYFLQHQLVGLWKQAVKERKNAIWGGIAVGLYAATMVGAAAVQANAGVKVADNYFDNVANTSVAALKGVKRDAYYYRFKYSRNQEIEADLVAYRFCEAVGIGGYAYIMALQLLGDNDVYMQADEDSEHPTTSFRVGLLKYLYNQEH